MYKYNSIFAPGFSEGTGAGKGEKTMKKHAMTTKALSVLLTVIMLFTTISVGLIVPEADLTASAAEVEMLCDSYEAIEKAIVKANSDPSNVYRIKLTKTITNNINGNGGGAVNKFSAITGQVIFDFNGNDISFEFVRSGDYDDKQHFDVQLPSENAVDGAWHAAADSVSHSMFTVAEEGIFQIVNSSNVDARMTVSTSLTNTTNGTTTSHQTSSSLIRCAGTLILGENAADTNSNFTLKSYSAMKNTSGTSGGSKNGANASAFAVTVEGLDAIFKMYGGSVEAGSDIVFRRTDTSYLVAIALNIMSCKSAEIYGGNINITNASAANKRADNPNEDNTYIATAIKCQSPNLYIFDVKSEVTGVTGYESDHDDDVYLTLSNVHSTSDANAAHIFGGHFYYKGTREDANNTAFIDAANFRNAYKLAGTYSDNGIKYDGPIATEKVYGSNAGYNNDCDEDNSISNTLYVYSKLVFADALARNGVNPEKFATFAEYIDSCSSDYYYEGGYSSSHINTSGDQTVTKYGYLRNGYTHTGWLGKTHPGNPYDSANKSTGAVGFGASKGGTLFLTPDWTPTLYNITYDFSDSTEYPVPETEKNLFIADNSRYKTYRIDTTDEIPVPTRPGYQFTGWTLTESEREATDDSFGWTAGGPYGNENENLSVLGHYGNIHLTANWKPVTYTIGIDINADGVVDTKTGDVFSSYSNGAINSAQAIPNWLEKDYYTFDGYYEVKEFDATSNWNLNDRITVATSSAAADRYTTAMISAQFAGRYGNIIKLTPHFTPVEYKISFDMDDDENREDRPSSSDSDYFYNVETVRQLPILTPPGQRFNGWRVVSSEGNWVTGRVYTSIPAGMHGDVKFIADYSDKEYKIEILLGEGEFFNISPNGYGYTFKEGGTIDGVASKNGYDFVGWEVVDSWSSFEGDTPDWITGEIYDYDNDTGLTYFDGGKVGNVRVKPHFVKHEYEITFNANSGSEVGSEKYKIDDTKTFPTSTRSGWTFGGWRVAETVGSWQKGDIYAAGSTVLSGLWGNVTLIAEWTATPYNVTLDLNGGEGVTNKVLGYKTTASTYLNETPVKTGYTFKGWSISVSSGSWGEYKAELEGKNAYVTNALPSGYYGDITLRAVWEATVYNLQFIRFPEHNKTYTYEETITLPSASAPGQNFVGWQLSDNTGNWHPEVYKAGATFTHKYGNVTFTPLWDAKTYTINYVDSDGVTAIGSPVIYRFTDSFKLNSHSKPGYTFIGWEVLTIADSADCGGWSIGDEFEAGDIDAGRFYGNVTLKAVYEVNEYKITFITDGGEPIADMLYTTESADFLPKPVKTGYDFGGWKVTTADGNWSLNSFADDSTELKGKYGDITLTAQWAAHYYSINWVVDGETTTTYVAYGENPVFNGTPVKAQDQQYSYEFIGWTPSVEPVTGDATYTAQFKSNLRVYSVTWKYLASDAAGAVETVVSETYKYGEHPVFPHGTPEKTSADTSIFYRFAGWYDGSNNKLVDATTVTGDVVYTADFTKVNKDNAIKIIWKVASETYETYWVAGDTPSYPGTNKLADKDGYTREILNWGDAGIEQIPADATPETYTKTYTATIRERVKDYQASFDLKGGKYAGQTIVTYNRNKNTPLVMPQPEKAGYTFMGWRVTKTESAMWVYNEIYTEESYAERWGEVSFEAVWKATEYTLTVKNDSVETKTVYTIESNSIIAPLTKEGYDLTGWLVLTADAGSSWMMGDTVATDKSLLGMYGNVTIEPVWSAKTYKLNWVSGDVTQTVEVRYGEYIVSYAPVSKAGYTAKWQDEIPVTMPAHDVTINAVYTPIQYFLRFNSNGGSEVESFYYDITSDKYLEIPTRPGATFKGWKVSAGGGSWLKDSVYDGGMALSGTYGNATLTAVWELEVFTITWIAGDVTRTTKWYHGAQPSFDGTPYKSPDFNNSYEFTGKWLTVNGDEIAEIPVVTGNATYEAVFRAVERIYTVKWDVDGRIYEQTYTYGQSVECPFSASNPPVRPSTNEYDFTFLGWSPEVTIVTGDVTYTAIFDVYTKIQGLRIDHSSIFIDIDDSTNVTAIISPSTATSKDVEWVSLNQNIATVNENGKIVGISAGETLIRVQSKDGKHKAFCLVSVAPVTTDYIVVSAAGVSTTRLPGEAVQLYATIMPENASNKIVKWTTSNPAVATVNANGLVVFGSTAGTAVITAMSDGYAAGSITVTCTSDEDLVKDDVKTYVVMFNKSSSTYIIAGQTYESINIVCKEGDTLEFLLTEPHFVTLNATQFERDTDGVYRIKNIKENYTVIASERPDLGFEPEEPEQNDGTVKLSFFEKLKNFFRSIVEFFRGLFGG